MKTLLAIKTPGPNSFEVNPVGGMPSYRTGDIDKLAQVAVEFMFVIATLIALAFLIWGGISWITSGGDKNALEAARKKLTYSLIGLVIVFLSFFIVTFVGNLFGVTLFNFSSR